jgi:hypothetical protein
VSNKYQDRIIFDAQVSERKILMVPVGSIKFTPYNPPSRTKDGKKLRQLVETIERYGVVYPILITADRELIDGNRRLTAAKIAGIKLIECIVSDLDKDELFGQINDTPLPMNGKGWLCVGRGGGRLPKTVAGDYTELHRLIGDFGIDQLIAKNIGLNILNLSKMVCSQGSSKPLAEVILSVANRRLTNKVNAVIRSEMTPSQKGAELDRILDEVEA